MEQWKSGRGALTCSNILYTQKAAQVLNACHTEITVAREMAQQVEDQSQVPNPHVVTHSHWVLATGDDGLFRPPQAHTDTHVVYGCTFRQNIHAHTIKINIY